MSGLSSICQAALDNHSDLSYRSVLGDYLEEAGDPRAALVRVVPSLLSTPRIDVDIYRYARRCLTVYKIPEIHVPMVPPHLRKFPPKYTRPARGVHVFEQEEDTRVWGDRCYWGCHNLGRLAAHAIFWKWAIDYGRVSDMPVFMQAEAGW
jgi:hypothetical protein